MASKGAFYKQVDKDFYDQVKKENGGKLPANLVDANGNPRKLTRSAADRGYRQKWLAIAAKDRKSKAVVSKDVDSPCVPCAIKAAAAKIPAILLPSKAMGKPAKLKTATPSEPPPPKKTEPSDEPCKHETLVVECLDEERKFKLQLPPAEDSEEATTQFEVIDNIKEKVTCTTKITAGPCWESHKGKVFDIYPADSVVSQSDEKLVFRANYGTDLTTLSFSDLFPPTKKRSPQTFNINVNTCQQDTLSATVAVYPQVDWKLDISLGWAAKGSVQDDKEGVPTEDRSSDFEFSGSVTVVVQGLTNKFGVEIKHELKKALKFADIACQTAEWLWFIASDIGGVDVTFDYPHLAFSGTWGWREIEGSPKCGYGYDWKVGFDPLIGAEVKVDILKFLITKFPVVGQIVQRVRELSAHAINLAVDFTAHGDLSGTYNASKDAGEPTSCFGELKGELEFTLEGKIESAQYHFWCFHVGGEVTVGGQATLTGDVKGTADSGGPYLQGEVKFDGLTIYLIVEGGIGVTFENRPPKEDEDYGTPDGNLNRTGSDRWEKTLWPNKQIFGPSPKWYFLGEEDGD